MSGAGYRAIWEDVTLITPLSFSHNCVHFTTSVSAQFWLVRIPQDLLSEGTNILEKIYRYVIQTYYGYTEI